MSDQNSYETLGLTESSSFDEIQEARNRLVEEHAEDRKRVEMIETAYDAILMERLRLRQEGKIKVPDRIRFAENASEPAPSAPAPLPVSRPDWLSGFIDTPSREEVVWPSVAFLGLALFGFYAPSLALALGVGCAIYFLNRKENKFWRSVLLTLAGLFVGFGLGVVAAQFLIPQGAQFGWARPDAIAAALTCLMLWVSSSFLR
ncbi:CPP1-like family protein [Pseudanabaena sp. FACHB-2040]|uniref:CPP1-like family protein n=1 Tax=Pseudanabaena sp. FACHB-2040 TaxID=2692859 RepID=UPI001688B9A7|nr:CPP1-like family protein [Pseudanabaena sp. FACHB-2040]MBD0267151.1 CPP1-like family protein [Cyanobacteria bacterium Co-bin8]MBD2255958.1 CPP1-like family protein [Pseudanabaena sp. FACHB-2040]